MSQQHVKITAGPHVFYARFEDAAPKTSAFFKKQFQNTYNEKIVHVRWSGEACWIPMGDKDLGLPHENATSHPAPGHIIVYPGGISETEVLLAYGPCSFSSKVGQVAGNHFLTIYQGLENLHDLGVSVLWKGAQDIKFELVSEQQASRQSRL